MKINSSYKISEILERFNGQKQEEFGNKKWVAIDDIKSFKGNGMPIHEDSPKSIRSFREAYNKGVLDTLNKLNKEVVENE